MKTFNIMENINSLVKKIISYSSTDRKALCIQLFSDWDLFETFSGTLTEANALDLIKRSLYQHEVAVILPNILQFSDSHTISERVFSTLCRYPNRKLRKSLLISIAHCKISFYQLHEICRRKICVEAFASLLDMYVALDVFTIDDLKKLISDNQWCVRAINFRLILDNGISTSGKRLFIETLLEKNETR